MFIQAVLILHLLICLGLIGAILLQRSEGGGALGMGGGPSSMMS
ncbi:MAG: preprotein translocase subunit SecG, partial [Hyphomonadaceae bacterium]